MADDNGGGKPQQQQKGGGKPPQKESVMIFGVRVNNFVMIVIVGTLVLAIARMISWLI